jgi:S1-C subfamily serine protease
MNGVDTVLVLAAVPFAVSGYRQGFLVGVLSFLGFLGGGLAGVTLAPDVVDSIDPPVARAAGAVVLVLALAVTGQVLTALVARRLRSAVTSRAGQTVDAVAGALVSVTALLLVAWLLAAAVGQAALPTLTPQVRDSRLLRTVDRVMPEPADDLLSSLRRTLDTSTLPRVFSGIGPERIVPVAPPDTAEIDARAVEAAAGSVVRVQGAARSCRRQVAGSGFVYAPERVMTNAHVVAGVRSPEVVLPGSRRLDATVIRYDPQRDVAVLRVPGLRATPLRFAGDADRGDSAVVAGYPQNGPLRADAARIRNQQLARGPDIYDERQVTRDIYAIYARVRPGNSGGPLLTPDGRVYGVVFAASLDDPATGYALTAAEVAPVARAGRGATSAVGTGPCV